MIIISKNERNYLEKHGCKFGKDIHRTYSKHHKYYMVESARNLKLLKEYADKSIIKTVTR